MLLKRHDRILPFSLVVMTMTMAMGGEDDEGLN